MGLFPIHLESLADPAAYDIVFISVGGSGQLGGQLAQFVLKKLDQESLKLPSDALKSGSHILKLSSDKILVLVVTAKGDTKTSRNLQINLNKAISAIKPDMPNRTIWMAPMGTGGGGLSYEESFRVLLDNLFALEDSNFSPESVMISLPNGLDAKALTSLESKLASWNESLIKDITSKLKRDEKSGRARDFYAAGHHWGSENQLERFEKDGIWENGHDAPHDLVKYVKAGDVLFAKSSYARPGQGYFRINGVGLVTGNDGKGHALKVNWNTFPSFDLTVGAQYRAVFHLIAPDIVDEILQGALNKLPNLAEILKDLGANGNIQVIRQIEEKIEAGAQFWWVNVQIVKMPREVKLSISSKVRPDWNEGDLVLMYHSNEEKLVSLNMVNEEDSVLDIGQMFVFQKNPTKQQLLNSREISEQELEDKEELSLPLSSFRKLINLTELEIGTSLQQEGINRPQINNDGAYTSEDLLDIENDVRSFALLLATEDIKPPLAIALFGRWGSGKSFFMKQVLSRIKELSIYQGFKADGIAGNNAANEEKPFCTGIAQIEFNAWSYLDDNLWAGLVTSIFEGLDKYIRDYSLGSEARANIQKSLIRRLKVMEGKRALLDLEDDKLRKEKERLETELTNLASTKKKAIEEIEKKSLLQVVDGIKKDLLKDDEIDQVFKEYGLDRKLSPEAAIREVNSLNTFLIRFSKFTRLGKILLIVGILIFFIVAFLDLFEIFQIAIDKALKYLISVIGLVGPVVAKGLDTFRKTKSALKPLFSYKDQFDSQLKSAQFDYQKKLDLLQSQIALKEEEGLEKQKEKHKIDQSIGELKHVQEEFLTTYAFKELVKQKANEEKYSQYTGLISIIRKDFQELSELFLELNSKEQEAQNVSGTNQELIVTEEEVKENIDPAQKSNAFDHEEKIILSEQFLPGKKLDRIILYIDDLDRCSDEKVLEVIQAVHLLMAFPLFNVVVGVDKRCVTNALLVKTKLAYRKVADLDEIQEMGIRLISPAEYLEKIFQIPYELREPKPTQFDKLIHSLLDKEGFIEEEEIETPRITDKETGDESDRDSDIAKLSKDSGISPAKSEKENPRKAAKPNSVTPANLKLKRHELDTMSEMLEVVGNTPRTIKRFINIYRIVRSHPDLGFNQSTDKESFRVLMLLLALSIGEYWRCSPGLFERLVSGEAKTIGEELEELIESEQKEIGFAASKVYQALENDVLGDLKKLRIRDYIEETAVQFIIRFSFANKNEKDD